MTKFNRAERRRQLRRMKARARKLYPHDPKARNADHLAVCSCWMCGNPRRYSNGPERTLQELRHDWREDLADLA